MARALRCNHHHVDRLARLNQREMYVEAVRERDRSAVLDVGSMLSFQMSACNSSGAHIMIRSAVLLASATDFTGRPSASAFFAVAEPSRSATVMFLQPESFRLRHARVLGCRSRR